MARAVPCGGEAGACSWTTHIIKNGNPAADSPRYIHVCDPLFVVQAVFVTSKVCFPIHDHGKPLPGYDNKQTGSAGIFAITARVSARTIIAIGLHYGTLYIWTPRL